MNEPITWGDLIIADVLWTILVLVGMGIFAVFIWIASHWERHKARQPDWENDWEDRT